jgi:tryptophanyl-tRNA synthetase
VDPVTTKHGRILSGMRPTGPLHLGNLVGALQNWVALQDDYDCFYMIADWHALMSEYHASKGIRQATYEVLADWLGAGLDPDRACLFRQSDVAGHSELHLILSCITPIAWLERCPTYKEQLQELEAKEVNTYAFLGYPVLQAADILIYRADLVPVGEDQLPHLEITREITRRFNALIGPVFPEPQSKLTRSARLLGLDRRKMSKSYGNAIYLGDAPEVLTQKVLSMISDPKRPFRRDPGHPDECNVHSYYAIFAPDEAPTVAEQCRKAEIGCQDCKRALAERMNAVLAPIRDRRQAAIADVPALERLLAKGAERAREETDTTMRLVHDALGF